MRTAWRSWFWNIVLMVVMTVMAAVLTGVALSQKNAVSAVGFGIAALLCWTGFFRAPTLGVYAKPRGVVVREFTRTTTIAWDEILGVELAQGGGPPVVTGPTAPVIRRRGKGGRAITVELNALGGYGLFRHDASPGQRAVADLNEHLKHWRISQSR
ncbi:PH domain-containing protein [Micromonospora zamorensis]|uniref:PH domain-containing protein n=1 Tax=Micromonospora zamorensis TaxID=709883 RepID=UPI003D9105FA